ncbi:SDR family oxidoreductase [Sphaerotilus mobilis]|uniref:Nucleoside-diphosphate-sugar epimerase n=1 Tax=Sphaerotilus mobilis TaxID=47994 RepID=A0A4Q7LD48_9BURK|nr:SDR family oxidoreductase [Sphaerotilus mobilis]RZS51964.1 nucleoside-diphosphate-sugar epimerase [Sphaerotilus mobilis]
MPLLNCPARAPLGALPRRLRRTRLLIIGCGDVGLRVARQSSRGDAGTRLYALTSQASRCEALRALGITPLIGNLDDAASLRRLAALAPRVLHLAPPPQHGEGDPRTLNLLRTLSRAQAVQRLVYASTTGVYGDAGGARFDETRPTAPASSRGQRRVAAEQSIRAWALRQGVVASVLRIPGIYALDRPGGHPRERLLRGTPVLRDEDDVHTNHIHADDLARICRAALWRGAPQRVYHACDDSALKMGAYFDLAADLCGLPRPPRISREQARVQLSPMLLSFMSESRQLDNRRLKDELRVALRHPHVRSGLVA